MKQPRNREARVPCAGAVALLRRVPREAPAPAGLQHLEAARSAEEAGPEGTEGPDSPSALRAGQAAHSLTSSGPRVL